MASVRKLYPKGHPKHDESPWVVEYTNPATGKRARATPKTGLKKDADKLRQKIEREIADGAHVAQSQTATLREAIEAWLEDCERRHRLGDNMAGATLYRYRGFAANHVLPELGARLLTSVEATDVQQLIDRKSVTLGHKSLKIIRTVLGKSLQIAVRRKWLKRHPLVDDPVRIPGDSNRREITVPSKAELKALLQHMGDYRPYEQPNARAGRILIVSLGLFAGLRRGEICGLQWEDVDFATGVINVRHSVSRQDGLKTPKTKRGRRTVPLSPVLSAVIDRYASDTGSDRIGQLLRTRNGTRYTVDNIGDREWKVVMKAADLMGEGGRPKYTLHVMRHAFLSLMIEQGVQPIVIKAVAGHARISTTMDTYGHLFPENNESRRAVLAIGNQFVASPLAPPAPVAQVECQSRDDWMKAKAEALSLMAEGVPVKEIARRFSTSPTLIYKWHRTAQRDTRPN